MEIEVFLNRTGPPLLGVVGTLDGRGWPHLVPVWFRYDGQAVHIWTHIERAWPRHLRRDPRVSFSVQEAGPPFAAVLMKGHAQVVIDGTGHWEEVRRICRRYLPAAAVEQYVAAWPELRTLVTIRPERVVSWARGY